MVELALLLFFDLAMEGITLYLLFITVILCWKS